MKLIPPILQFDTSEKYWDDAKEGDECNSPTYEVTEQRINAYEVLTGDFTPLYIDEDYAKKRHLAYELHIDYSAY
jgi:acyl dehydratase